MNVRFETSGALYLPITNEVTSEPSPSEEIEQGSYVYAMKRLFEKAVEPEKGSRAKTVRRANTVVNLKKYYEKPLAQTNLVPETATGASEDKDSDLSHEGSDSTASVKESAPPLRDSGRYHKPALVLDLSTLKKEQKEKGKERATTAAIHPFTTLKREGMLRSASSNSLLHGRKVSRETGELLSILSPRGEWRGKYYVEGEETSAERTGASLKDLPLADKRNSFNKRLVKFLESTFKRSSSMPAISDQMIEQSVIGVCRREIDELFSDEAELSTSELQVTESPRSKILLSLIRKSGVLLVPVIQRLKVLRQGLSQYTSLQGKKTIWAQKLADTLDCLITPDKYEGEELGLDKGKDLAGFLDIVESLKGRKGDSKIYKLVMLAFGDKAKVRKQVMATLKKWEKPPVNFMDRFKEQVHKMSWQNVAATNIPFVQHEWCEGWDAKAPIDAITVREVVRCLATENAVIMDRIEINSETVYQDDPDATESGYSQKDFLEYLMGKIYRAGLKPDISDDEIAQEAAFLVARSKDRKSDRQGVSCLPLLRLCTMSAWGHADAYFRELFPGLFAFPDYWTKLLPGIECRISVEGRDAFSVTLRKRMGTFPRQNKKDPGSTLVDRSQLLATIPLEWTLSHGDDGWEGILNIPEAVAIENRATSKQKWDILKAIINFTDLEIAQESQSPGTPRMRSNLKPNLTRADLLTMRNMTARDDDEDEGPMGASSVGSTSLVMGHGS